jgi:ABC-type uncharacterized transport system involved in gliding motility auxiliary subunit
MAGPRSFLSPVKGLLAVLGPLSLLLAVLVKFFLPDLTQSVYGLLILGVFLLLLYILAAAGEILTFIGSKRGRYSANTVVMAVVFIAIMIMANTFGLTLHRRFDVTASAKFTLAPQTQRIVKELKQPVTAIGFYPNESQYRGERESAQDLLEEYRYFNRNLDYKFVDPDAQPALAKQYRVQRNGTIVFISGNRQKVVGQVAEQSFTGALLEVTGVSAKKIYFLSGHGERDANNPRNDGYAMAMTGLARELYQVETLNLTITPSVPQDCAVLIVAGPRNALPAAEVDALKAYLKKNGKALFLLDPNPPAEIAGILAAWGLVLGQGHVVDPTNYVAPDKSTPAVFRDKYPPVIVTTGLDTTYFPDATSVQLTPELGRVLTSREDKPDKQRAWPISPVQYSDLAILPVVLSSENSWLESEPKGLTFQPETETKGPLALAAMMIAAAPLGEPSPEESEQSKLTRLLVVGDSDFAANEHFQNGGNGDLFLNAVNWLAEEENLISIRPKPYTFRRMVISDNATRFIRFSSIGLLPLIVLIVGGVIWYRKR